ncbi:MAG: carboxypeptidase-like regulatory domain-containing protein [Acidimicrobiales bacterium]
MSRSRGRTRAGLVLLVLALLTVGCRDAPAPTGEVSEAPSTVPPTTLPPTTALGRPRETTTVPVDIAGGKARIQGMVQGPQGPVEGATVRIERIVGTQTSATDLSAGPGGTFNLGDIRGGRYRLRAWKQPDLLQVTPDAFFLAADESKVIDLKLVRTSEVALNTTTEPARLPSDETFSIRIFLYAGSVGGAGELQAVPRANVAMQIIPGPGFAVVGGDKATTDSAGNVTFRARCTRPGPPGGDVAFSTFKLPLDLPVCPG